MVRGRLKKVIGVVLVIVFSSISVYGASGIFIVYTVGQNEVDISGNGHWQRAKINMKLRESSIVRTGVDGGIEIDINGQRIAIGKSSTIEVWYLIKHIQKNSKAEWLSKVLSIIESMVGFDSGPTKAVLLGTRGKTEDELEMEWAMEEEEQDFRTKFFGGKKYYSNKEYLKAINLFKDLIDESTELDMRGEVEFFLGLSLFNNFQYEGARYYLGKSIEEEGAFYYKAALINYALVCFFLNDYREVSKSLEVYLEKYGAIEELAPYVYLILGKSYKALGRKVEASKYFTRIEREYRGTEVYYEAMKEKERLKGQDF